jgi:hypothetical protein
MFRQVRYQTGEIDDIIHEMRKGDVPCMDVEGYEELDWFIGRLATKGIHRVEDLPYDKNARDRIREPEFEFRVGFSEGPVRLEQADSNALLYIDFYFEPDPEDSYDPVGEM